MQIEFKETGLMLICEGVPEKAYLQQYLGLAVEGQMTVAVLKRDSIVVTPRTDAGEVAAIVERHDKMLEALKTIQAQTAFWKGASDTAPFIARLSEEARKALK